MKKYLLFLALAVVAQIKAEAQQTQFRAADHYTVLKSATLTEADLFSKKSYTAGKYTPERDADFYLKRSKNQRTVGWVTLGGGLLLSGIGVLLVNGDFATSNKNEDASAIFIIAGATSGIVSIPFMIMASANRHKAKVLMSKQKTGFGTPSNVGKYITGITMTIPFGK